MEKSDKAGLGVHRLVLTKETSLQKQHEATQDFHKIDRKVKQGELFQTEGRRSAARGSVPPSSQT